MSEITYTIDLFGAAITIRTEEDYAYIDTVVRRVRDVSEKVRESLGLQDQLTVAVMTTVFLSDEVVRLSKQAQQSPPLVDVDQVGIVLSSIESLLDRTLKN
jgi:cell division protein ZapA (FtsZ GTPase activity inhibitor)